MNASGNYIFELYEGIFKIFRSFFLSFFFFLIGNYFLLFEIKYQLIRYERFVSIFRDDYINLCSRDYAELKSFAEDLTDGKFSFPIVAAVRHGDADDEILSMLFLIHLF